MKKKVLFAAVLALALCVAPIGKSGISVSTASSNSTVSSNNTTTGNVQTQLEATLPADHFTAVENNTAVKLDIAVGVSTSNDAVREAVGLKDNESVKVVVGVKSDADITESEKDLINSAAQGMTVISDYLDLSMIKTAENGSESIHQLNSEITFVITIPSEYDVNNNDFSIIRVHDGVATVLPDLDQEASTVTFSTDRFSTYAIAYSAKSQTPDNTEETEESGNDTQTSDDTAATDAKDSVPKTGDSIPAAVPAMAALGLAVAAVVLSKKKEA